MNPKLALYLFAVRWKLKQAVNKIAGSIAIPLLRAVRLLDRKHTANASGRFLRVVGPLLPEHRIGRANLKAAFPEKSSAEISAILAGAWDNLGRVAAEFAHLDRVVIFDPAHPAPADVDYDAASNARFHEIAKSSQPTLFFTAHTGNWEIPALGAAAFGVDVSALYRPPNIRAISDAVLKIRAGCMGTLIPSGLDAPVRLARALERGGHVGMLLDQHYGKGVDVVFFGRTCKANPLLARLARQFDCPIRGVRTIRLPDGNHFRGEITEPVEPKRDADGRINVQGTTQAITTVIEGWVREHPEQWLWQHRRWR
jgi:KDO2-lipid IV(A) lauroyltransferase